MDGSVLEEKTSFKMLGLTFSSKLDLGSYIVSIAKTASKKIGGLIHSMKFLSPEVALYLYKSTIRPCMEYCCHVWAGAPSCYVELLDKSSVKWSVLAHIKSQPRGQTFQAPNLVERSSPHYTRFNKIPINALKIKFS